MPVRQVAVMSFSRAQEQVAGDLAAAAGRAVAVEGQGAGLEEDARRTGQLAAAAVGQLQERTRANGDAGRIAQASARSDGQHALANAGAAAIAGRAADGHGAVSGLDQRPAPADRAAQVKTYPRVIDLKDARAARWDGKRPVAGVAEAAVIEGGRAAAGAQDHGRHGQCPRDRPSRRCSSTGC